MSNIPHPDRPGAEEGVIWQQPDPDAYTILSAAWANEAHDALTLVTTEAAALSISQLDAPALWEKAVAWIAANPIAAYVPPPAPTAQQKLEALGLTADDLRTILGGGP